MAGDCEKLISGERTVVQQCLVHSEVKFHILQVINSHLTSLSGYRYILDSVCYVRFELDS